MSLSERHGTTRPLRRTMCLAAACLLGLALPPACTRKQREFQVGDHVQVSGVAYTVHDVEWTGELDGGGSGGVRTPKNRFLVVNLTMQNTGNKEVTLPLLNAVDSAGADHLELSEGQGVPEWLGILRTLSPTESRQGRIVFDVPVGVYRLKLSDGGDQESERTALVALPAAAKHSLDSPILNEPKKE
jgi:Domain of unknown function (DUF4352)